MARLGEWNQCHRCCDDYQVTDLVFLDYCPSCVRFKVDLTPMAWREFQKQRAVLTGLVVDERMTEAEQEALMGILNLTDHIVDAGRERGFTIPSFEDIVLDRMADA